MGTFPLELAMNVFSRVHQSTRDAVRGLLTGEQLFGPGVSRGRIYSKLATFFSFFFFFSNLRFTPPLCV